MSGRVDLFLNFGVNTRERAPRPVALGCAEDEPPVLEDRRLRVLRALVRLEGARAGHRAGAAELRKGAPRDGVRRAVPSARVEPVRGREPEAAERHLTSKGRHFPN